MSTTRQKRPRRALTPLEARARRIRHIGYVVFLALIGWVVTSLVGSVVGTLTYGTPRDPFIDARVVATDEACAIWADELLQRAETGDESSTHWQVEARGWRHECSRVERDAVMVLESLLVR